MSVTPIDHSSRPQLIWTVPAAEPEAPPVAPSDGLIEDLARVVAQECEADDILVALHEPDRDTAALFFMGRHAGCSATQRSLLAVADDALLDTGAGAAWTTIALEDDETAGVLTTRVVGEASATGRITITTLFGTIGEATRGRARKVAQRLAPLVSAFFRLWQQRLRVAAQLEGLTAAVNHSDVGVVIVDETASILFGNAAAQAMLGQRDGVRTTGGRLAAGRLGDTLRLQAAIAHVAAADGVDAGHAEAPVIALPRPGRRALMAALVAAGTAGGGSVIVHLFDPDTDLAALVDPVCKHYGLSPVETRLARLIAGGASLSEAAEAMRVREQSARSYLKHIFLKTETKRQGELVGLLLRSSVRTTPACQTNFILTLK
ncbi:helix-turn-helix transcriptional regulator [Sphingomonas floccifaciens]|uniref:Helix-turn-helix transcriptional regulator n=1 Tax=Sphingomonas floccifaciens TaxID=1844115 RepID=A0ABW4NAU8_9SPHN